MTVEFLLISKKFIHTKNFPTWSTNKTKKYGVKLSRARRLFFLLFVTQNGDVMVRRKTSIFFIKRHDNAERSEKKIIMETE